VRVGPLQHLAEALEVKRVTQLRFVAVEHEEPVEVVAGARQALAAQRALGVVAGRRGDKDWQFGSANQLQGRRNRRRKLALLSKSLSAFVRKECFLPSRLVLAAVYPRRAVTVT
jgi:hypothetical protein